MALSSKSTNAVTVYNGTVNATKAEVTDNPNVHIYSIALLNATAAEAYLQVYDADSSNVTVGTTVADFVIGNGAEGAFQCVFNPPIQFTTGFSIASTTARAGSTNAVQEVTITYASEA